MKTETDNITPRPETIEEAIAACERSLAELIQFAGANRRKGLRKLDLVSYNRNILLPRLKKKLREAQNRELFT